MLWDNLEGGMGVRGRLKREGVYISLWLIPIVVGQKPARHCKAVFLQLNNIINFLKKMYSLSSGRSFCIVIRGKLKAIILYSTQRGHLASQRNEKEKAFSSKVVKTGYISRLLKLDIF